MNHQCLDFLIYGKKFKRILDKEYMNIKEKYDLKQIDLDILLYYQLNPDSSASNICQDLGFNKGQISKALEQLVLYGYLKSTQDPKDRRYITYSVTDKSECVIKDITDRRHETEKTVFKGITESEINTMQSILLKFFKNIEELEDNRQENQI